MLLAILYQDRYTQDQCILTTSTQFTNHIYKSAQSSLIPKISPHYFEFLSWKCLLLILKFIVKNSCLGLVPKSLVHAWDERVLFGIAIKVMTSGFIVIEHDRTYQKHSHPSSLGSLSKTHIVKIESCWGTQLNSYIL